MLIVEFRKGNFFCFSREFTQKLFTCILPFPYSSVCGIFTLVFVHKEIHFSITFSIISSFSLFLCAASGKTQNSFLFCVFLVATQGQRLPGGARI